MTLAEHDSLTIDREFATSPEQVFTAWADVDIKARWFMGPKNWEQTERAMDFRVGGDELMAGHFGDEMETRYTAHYYEIVPNARIVYNFDVVLNRVVFSASLVTVEFTPCEKGARMRFTEQIAFLDGTDRLSGVESRIKGTEEHYDRLAALLAEMR